MCQRGPSHWSVHRLWVLLIGCQRCLWVGPVALSWESLQGSSLGLTWGCYYCWLLEGDSVSGSRVSLEFPGSDFGDVSGANVFSIFIFWEC